MYISAEVIQLNGLVLQTCVVSMVVRLSVLDLCVLDQRASIQCSMNIFRNDN